MKELESLIKASLEKLDWREHSRIERIICEYSSTAPFQPHIDIRFFKEKPSIKPKKPRTGAVSVSFNECFQAVEATPEVCEALEKAGISYAD